MAVKELVKQVMDQMPEDADIEQVIRALYIAAKVEHGSKAYHSGDFVTQEEAKKRMSKWLG